MKKKIAMKQNIQINVHYYLTKSYWTCIYFLTFYHHAISLIFLLEVEVCYRRWISTQPLDEQATPVTYWPDRESGDRLWLDNGTLSVNSSQPSVTSV